MTGPAGGGRALFVIRRLPVRCRYVIWRGTCPGLCGVRSEGATWFALGNSNTPSSTMDILPFLYTGYDDGLCRGTTRATRGTTQGTRGTKQGTRSTTQGTRGTTQGTTHTGYYIGAPPLFWCLTGIEPATYILSNCCANH